MYCFSLKKCGIPDCGNTQEFLVCSLSRLKPGLHIVATIAEHACGHVLNRVLKLLIYRSQTFLVKYKHMRSLQLCEDQGIPGKLKNMFATLCLRFLRFIWRPGSSPVVNRNGRNMVDNTNKEGLYKIMTEKSSELVNSAKIMS